MRPLISTLLLVLSATCLAHGVDVGDMQAAVAKGDKALAKAKTDWHLAQAKIKEGVIKDLEKLYGTENKRKNSMLAPELRRRIDLLNAEVVMLKDEPMMYAIEVNKMLVEGSFVASEWDNVATETIITVDGKTEWTDTKIKINAGNVWLLVPHPDDTWKGNTAMSSVGYLGFKGQPMLGAMRLTIKVGETLQPSTSFILSTDNGRLMLGNQDEKDWSDNSGSMRVKLLRIR